jgi:DNA-binding transcriptional LysR family regulator
VGATFPLTAEGQEFVEQAAAGWAQAARADGEPAGPANEAAQRTVAFYTTPPAGPVA